MHSVSAVCARFAGASLHLVLAATSAACAHGGPGAQNGTSDLDAHAHVAAQSQDESTSAPVGSLPPRTTAPPRELLPAGLCTFEPYLREACGGAPVARFVVVLATTANATLAEAALERARTLGLAAGYPFAATFDEMAALDRARRGVAIVAGLFSERAHADAYARQVSRDAEVVELASFEEAMRRDLDRADELTKAIELSERTAAFALEDLEAIDAELDEASARRSMNLAEQRAQRERALASVTPLCTLERGRVFTSAQHDVYALARDYAPVRCDDGRPAWVPWHATRLESVVTRASDGPSIHQVVFVECDQATVESRRFDAGSSASAPRYSTHGPC